MGIGDGTVAVRVWNRDVYCNQNGRRLRMRSRRNGHNIMGRVMSDRVGVLCQFVNDGGRWVCQWCKRPTRSSRPPVRQCRVMVASVVGAQCSLAPAVSRLTPTGVDRLRRCRAASCGLMLQVEGSTRCVGMPGSKCQWLGEWVARLNSDAEFGCGGNECPHWAKISDTASTVQT